MYIKKYIKYKKILKIFNNEGIIFSYIVIHI